MMEVYKNLCEVFLNKVLLIRFSSFGDVTQTLSIPTKLKNLNSQNETQIHWVTRADFAPLLANHPALDHVWLFNKKEGLLGLMRLISKLRKEKFTHIYDAHNNLRSRLISFCLAPPVLRSFMGIHFLRKSQKRWKRFLLFQFRKNTYRMPFSGQRDLLEPLQAWGIDETLPNTPQIFLTDSAKEFLQQWKTEKQISNYVCFAASAAHALKRWPISHWQTLFAMHPRLKWIALGGPEDLFIEEFQKKFPGQVVNMAGKTDYQQTAALIAGSDCLVTNDTGVLHIGEQLGHPVIALMGPAPFGFPSRKTTSILEMNLDCRPCSKHGQGPCVNKNFHLCMNGITPQIVSENLLQILGKRGPS